MSYPIAAKKLYVDGSFKFLNVTRQFDWNCPDWSPGDAQRLWAYNLHYFDYLRQTELDDSQKLTLVSLWVAGNPQLSRPAWEPFPASKRIVNWIFYFNSCRERGVFIPHSVLVSLYEQVLWLEKNLERHILANHYFENLKALAFSSAFFAGRNANRWRQKAGRGLLAQLAEQNLADGGHYERTPQYHSLMLENYLDLYNVVNHNRHLFEASLYEALQLAATAGLTFLADIVFPDRKIPLFNDSAFHVAPDFDELECYANRLFPGEMFSPDSCGTADSTLIDKPHSGFYGYRQAQDMIVVECGAISPSYQPGHTHCGLLSYELMVAGERVIVDSGVCEYEPGQLRQIVRSTRAHNTVSVDGTEQSEVWGEFRVARRAKVMSAGISRVANRVLFWGGYAGFYTVKGGATHTRKIELVVDESNANISQLDIADEVVGSGCHLIESFVHFHPDIRLKDNGDGTINLVGKSRRSMQFAVNNDVDYRIEKSIYCPEFGLQLENQCVVMSLRGTLPCQLSYRITMQ